MRVAFTCEYCGKNASQDRGAVNRARRNGRGLYCDRACAGLARRVNKADDVKRAEKAAYDREYRAKNLEEIKAKKNAAFRANYDPKAAAIARKKTMPRHVAYCRRPEYRVKKAEYDREYRSREYGEFAEAHLATIAITREVNSRMSRNELYATKGTQNKTQNRRRDHERLVRNYA